MEDILRLVIINDSLSIEDLDNLNLISYKFRLLLRNNIFQERFINDYGQLISKESDGYADMIFMKLINEIFTEDDIGDYKNYIYTYWAIIMNYTDIMDNFKLTETFYNNLICRAIEYDRIELVKRLLPNVNIKNTQLYNQLLNTAIDNNSTYVFEELGKRGFPLKNLDNEISKTLCRAVRFNSIGIVKIILHYGEISDLKQATELCCLFNYSDIVEILLKYISSSELQQSLENACISDSVDCFKQIVQKYPNLLRGDHLDTFSKLIEQYGSSEVNKYIDDYNTSQYYHNRD